MFVVALQRYRQSRALKRNYEQINSPIKVCKANYEGLGKSILIVIGRVRQMVEFGDSQEIFDILLSRQDMLSVTPA